MCPVAPGKGCGSGCYETYAPAGTVFGVAVPRQHIRAGPGYEACLDALIHLLW
jgi:hypothetical protein